MPDATSLHDSPANGMTPNLYPSPVSPPREPEDVAHPDVEDYKCPTKIDVTPETPPLTQEETRQGTKKPARKQNAPHQPPFLCKFPRCPRGSKGFAAFDDLERHSWSIHSTSIPGFMWLKCFAHGCSESDSIWRTLGSFKRHLKNRHPNDNLYELLRRSNNWYNLQSEESTIAKDGKMKKTTSDSGYFSWSDTSAHWPEFNSVINLPNKWRERDSECQVRSPDARYEGEDLLASLLGESKDSHASFRKTHYQMKSSTSDAEFAEVSFQASECRLGQQSPQPLVSSDGELSFMGSTDSDELAEDWEVNLDPMLRLLRSKLIAELIGTYMNKDSHNENMQRQPYTAVTTSDSNTSSGRESSSNTDLGTSSILSKDTSCGKRQKSLGEGEGEDEDGPQFPGRKRRRETTTSISLDGRLLACPYSKFDPMRYSEQNLSEKNYRGCSSIYLTTISRLKQHLYRVHKRPDNYCLSCFDIFQSEELLSAHNRARPPCEVQDPQFEERMTTEQFNLVKRRSVGKTLVETWFAIFSILFPGTPLPATPFVDSVSPEAIRRFLDHFFRQARPRLSHLVQHHLEGRLLLESDQQRLLDSALESAIAQLVRETDPRQEDVPVEEVQPGDMEDYLPDAATQAPLPQVTLPTSPVGGGYLLEEFHEEDPGYFNAVFLGDPFQ